MQRVSVFVCAVAVLLTAEVDVRGSSGVINAVKQRSSALVQRWQQRVAPRIKARWEQVRLNSLLVPQHISVSPTAQQAVVAVALCTLLGCAGVTQSPENAAPQEVVEQQAPATAEAPATVETPDTAPEIQRDNAQIIRTELFGEGIAASRGLTYDSIAAYENNKEKLPIQFYHGMMVHYIKDGGDHVRIVDLIGDSALKVRHIDRTFLELVGLGVIEGVVVGTHPDYGTRFIAVEAQFLRELNNDGGQQLLNAIPKETVFYGVPNLIFSDGDYVVKLLVFSPPQADGKIYSLPEAVRFVTASEHLVTVTDPKIFEKIIPPKPRQQFRNRPLQRRHLQQVAQVE